MTVSTPPTNLPEYGQLVKFLFQPFLGETDVISVDCEYTIDRHRVWIRVAVASADRGTVFGRGGRNIQAIRTVLQSAAATVDQSVYVDIYGSDPNSRHLDSDSAHRDERANNFRSGSTTDGAAAESRSSGSRPRIVPNRRPAGGDSPSVPPPRPRR